jgi:hypothetical protein
VADKPLTNDDVLKGFATMLKDDARDFEEQPLNQHEIAFLIQRCFEGLKDPYADPQAKEVWKVCLKILKEEITYN